MSNKFFTSWIVMVILAACTPIAPSEAPPSSTPAPLDPRVDVGGYKLRIVCSGQGAPTVIVDAAWAEPALESGNWLNVRYGLEETTRVCIYDRAGLGSSDAPPTQPRTSQDMVKDLHTLLVNGNIQGPYILVGHDIGGLNIHLYASQYPDEVAGIVLVDALHPDYESEIIAVLPPESPGEPEILKSVRQYGILPDSSFVSPENIDFIASANQVRAAGQLDDIPLVVLTSGPSWGVPDLSPDVEAKFRQVWQDLQDDMTSLSSNGTQMMVTEDGSFTYIPLEEPQLIIKAILKVFSEAKK